MCMLGVKGSMNGVCAPEATGTSFGHINRNAFASMGMEKSLGDNPRVRVGKDLKRLKNTEKPINAERTTESSLTNPSTSSAILVRNLTA